VAELRSPDEHRDRAVALMGAPRTETVALHEALGRVTAGPAVALAASPLWDNSAMDGYAVRLGDTAGATSDHPVRLAADAPTDMGGWERHLAPGEAIAVMTGAPVPEGCEAIVPVELVRVGDGWIEVLQEPRPAAHLRRAGEDAAVGALVVPSGTRLGAAALAALAATGHASVVVAVRPRVAIIATGAELVAPGANLPPRGSFDSNSLMLAAAATDAGAEVVFAGRVGDDPSLLVDELERHDADLVVTTGGVSMGEFDVVKAALAGRGVDFVTLAMQPGKPQGIGRLPGGTPILALPGNPVAALASFHLFVRPAIRAALGLEPWPSLPTLPAAVGWASPAGKLQVIPVTRGPEGVRPAAKGGSGSHLVASLAAGEAWALVAPEVTQVAEGDLLPVVGWES